MTPNPTALAFDLGASSGRALIGELIDDHDGKRIIIKEIQRFPNEGVSIGDHLYWDILMILQEIKRGIQQSFLQGYEPQSFAIDTWGVDFGLLDRNGELLGNPYHYRDHQTVGMVEELTELFGEEKMFKESGLQFMPFNSIYQLYAMKKANSSKLQVAETLLLIPDLLNYFLTGIKSCEYTIATTTQLFNPVSREWNKSLLDQMGIPDSLFLQPVVPGTSIGRLSETVCRELGVPPLQAIAVASHDTESAVAAIGNEEEQFAYIVGGTWSLLGTQLPEAILTDEVRQLQFSNEGGAENNYQLLKNIMGLWLLQRCRYKWAGEGLHYEYHELVEMARQSDPFRCFIDPDNPRFMNPADMVDEIRSFCIETGQQQPRNEGEIVRCIMESLALRYKKVLLQLEQVTSHQFPHLHMVGGGIQNEWLCQFTSNAIGRPVIAGPIEASGIGNILYQFISGGHIADPREGAEVINRSFPKKVYVPRDEEAWEEAYETFTRIATSI